MYGFSLITTGRGVHTDNQCIYAPLILTEIPYQDAMAGNVMRTKYPPCVVPTGEYTVAEGWGNVFYDEQYATLFKGHLQGTGSFDGRYVTETMSWASPLTSTYPIAHSDGCYYAGSAFDPQIPRLGTWTVGYVSSSGGSYSEANSYGYDTFGLLQLKLVDYQRNLRETDSGPCNIRYVQQMSYSCCTGNYNDLRWYKNNSMTITLGQYSVTNQRDNVSLMKSIP